MKHQDTTLRTLEDGFQEEEVSVSERMRGSSGGKPLLLLDVDGVVNAMPLRRRPRGYSRHMIDAYQVHIHDDIRAMIDELRENFDMAWFTMWNDLAAPLIGPHVGLEEIPFVETSWERGWAKMNSLGYSRRQINKVFYAKTPLLVDALNVAQRWAWIDDAHSRWDQQYLERHRFDPKRFRLVGTDASVGLTWHEVDQAVKFAQTSAGMADTTLPVVSEISPPIVQRDPTKPHHPGSVPGRATAVTPADRAGSKSKPFGREST